MNSKIHFLKANHGDSFVIETNCFDSSKRIILIDGGTTDTFKRHLKPLLKEYSEIDMLLLTHTDDDHIKGLVSFFKSDLYYKINIKEYWANCRYSIKLNIGQQISFGSAKNFDQFLIEKEGKDAEFKWNKDIIFTGNPVKMDDIELLVLSPHQKQVDSFYINWKDSGDDVQKAQVVNEFSDQLYKGSIVELAKCPFLPTLTLEEDFVNASSIAFLMKSKTYSVLFLGDARPEIIIYSLLRLGYNTTTNKLKIDYLKISHHGSKNNTSNELLSYIDCNHFIISTNGGTGKSKHPDRETIARILCRENKGKELTHLYFNYNVSEIEKKAGKFITEDECKTFNCILHENVTIIPL